MKESFKLFGAEISPFSIKVRSYLKYKKIPHKWITKQHSKEYLKYAKLPLTPLLLSSEGSSMQDSTPIIESLEKKYKNLSIYPEDSRRRRQGYRCKCRFAELRSRLHKPKDLIRILHLRIPVLWG